MALRKIIKVDGTLILEFNNGLNRVSRGSSNISMLATIRPVTVTCTKLTGTATVEFTDDISKFTKSYDFPVSSVDGAPNIIKQIYEHLKTLPEFTNSENC